MIKRQVFFSFRNSFDAWRASQVRQMEAFDANSTFSDNDWEVTRSKSDYSIENWINSQMKMRSCVVVLIGAHTQGRKWINYEIQQAWKSGKGIVGIYIHGLKDREGEQAFKGSNPFEDFCVDTTFNYIEQRKTPLDSDERNLSKIVKAYNPPYINSKDVYDYIKRNMSSWIEEAIAIRNRYPK